MPPSRDVISQLMAHTPPVSRALSRGKVRQYQPGVDTRRRPPFYYAETSRVDYMQEVNQRHIPRLRQIQPLKPFLQEPMLSIDPDTALMNEDEVLIAAEKVLIEPVIRGLKGLFDLRIRCRREQPKSMVGGGTSRLDVVWEYCQESESHEPWKPFALMEYKNTNVIHEAQFVERICGRAKDNQGNLVSLQDLMRTAPYEKKNSLLQGNAMGLVKTARWYGSRLPHVVMFDWDAMATFDFTEFDFADANPHSTKPNRLQMEMFQENPEALARDESFGRLLLEFLAHALEWTLSNPSQA